MIKKTMNYLLPACLLIILTVSPSLAITPKAPPASKATHITAEEVNKMFEDQADFLLIDARYDELFKDGHIPGAISLPADVVNAETLAEHSDDMSKKLVFYCQDINCPASRIGAAKAIGAGYKYVYEFSGGYEDWKSHGYKVTKAQLK